MTRLHMIFSLGNHELLIILIAVAFFVVGVPTMGLIVARMGKKTADSIKRGISSFFSLLRGKRA